MPLAWYGGAAKRFEEAGRKSDARRALTSILESRPGEEQAFAAMARALQGQGRWQESVPHWRSARDAAGTKVAANFGLAEALIETGAKKEARRILADLERDGTLDSAELFRLQQLVDRAAEARR